MVNHLARGSTDIRDEQAIGLRQWAEMQTLPVIAVGDYNFDYRIDDGEGNIAMGLFLTNNIWKWVKPDRLHQTQGSQRFYSVLDFIFTANMPNNWIADSSILIDNPTSNDLVNTSDHRPIEARFLISE